MAPYVAAQGDRIAPGSVPATELLSRVGGFIAGCGQAALAVILNASKGTGTSPSEVTALIQQSVNEHLTVGKWASSGMSSPQTLETLAAEHGVQLQSLGYQTALAQYAGNRDIILGVKDAWAFGGTDTGIFGHYITVVGVRADGSYIVSDPNTPESARGQFVNYSPAQIDAAHPFWAGVSLTAPSGTNQPTPAQLAACGTQPDPAQYGGTNTQAYVDAVNKWFGCLIQNGFTGTPGDILGGVGGGIGGALGAIGSSIDKIGATIVNIDVLIGKIFSLRGLKFLLGALFIAVALLGTIMPTALTIAGAGFTARGMPRTGAALSAIGTGKQFKRTRAAIRAVGQAKGERTLAETKERGRVSGIAEHVEFEHQKRSDIAKRREANKRRNKALQGMGTTKTPENVPPPIPTRQRGGPPSQPLSIGGRQVGVKHRTGEFEMLSAPKGEVHRFGVPQAENPLTAMPVQQGPSGPKARTRKGARQPGFGPPLEQGIGEMPLKTQNRLLKAQRRAAQAELKNLPPYPPNARGEDMRATRLQDRINKLTQLIRENDEEIARGG